MQARLTDHVMISKTSQNIEKSLRSACNYMRFYTVYVTMVTVCSMLPCM